MKSAAGKLKTLDGDFQKALLKVMREPRVAYFTVGHGELNEATGAAATEGRSAKVLGAYTLGSGQDLPLVTPAEAEIGPKP